MKLLGFLGFLGILLLPWRPRRHGNLHSGLVLLLSHLVVVCLLLCLMLLAGLL
jgi:hypothetical protein